MFETELRFFKKKQKELVKQHPGKALVLRGKSVANVYDTPIDAYLEASKLYPEGSFMIQPCEPGPGAYTVNIATAGILE